MEDKHKDKLMQMIGLKEVMFHKGERYTCIEKCEVDGVIYFNEHGNYYCPMDNCLVTEVGERFVQQQYLKHFFILKDE